MSIPTDDTNKDGLSFITAKLSRAESLEILSKSTDFSISFRAIASRDTRDGCYYFLNSKHYEKAIVLSRSEYDYYINENIKNGKKRDLSSVISDNQKEIFLKLFEEDVENTKNQYITGTIDKAKVATIYSSIQHITEEDSIQVLEDIKQNDLATKENKEQEESDEDTGDINLLDAIKQFEFTPKQIGEYEFDFTGMPANKTFLIPQKNILSNARPVWIPKINENELFNYRFIPLFEKKGSNYIIYSDHENPIQYLVTPEIFTATIDYYINKQRAKNKQISDDKNADAKSMAESRLNEDKFGLTSEEIELQKIVDPSWQEKEKLGDGAKEYFKETLAGKHNVKAKRVSVMSSNRMSYPQLNKFYAQKLSRKQAFEAYTEIRNELAQKQLDMQAQVNDYRSAYTKGAETSYGDSNTNKVLLDKYGVMIKRQNGDAINDEEIQEIKNAFEGVNKVFGDIKNI
ncbi:hypothetical protein, partial [Candidatus Endomicrobiellum trichonymphae]|uniref:hypothetical protein n=1 Tax=Endomicrobium trichonymphae TaxID=1408204 RepID=UPI0039B89823